MNTDGGIERRGRGRGRGNRSRGRGRGRGRGARGKKIMTRSPPEPEHEPELELSDEDVSMEQLDEEPEKYVDESTGTSSAITLEELTNDESIDNDPDTAMANAENESTVPTTIDMEADISQLEAPTFTTLTRSPPEPMLRLKWDHKVNLIGEKVLNPMIHCCDQCDKPILVYGRMIPCKHVFCLKCARAEPVKICPRCKDKVIRVEQSGLGTVFMCTHGGSTYGNTGCRRTYLSQRDLQAHINHRHISQPMPTNVEQTHVKPLQLGEAKPAGQRKVSECSSPVSATSTIASAAPPNRTQSKPAGTPTATLTVANVARINSGATMQDMLHPLTKANLQQAAAGTSQAQSIQQPPTIPNETVADASYYSSVLNSYGNPSTNGSNVHPINPNFAQVSQASAHQSSPTNQPTPVSSVPFTPQMPPTGSGGNQTPTGFYPFGTQFGQVAPPNFNPNNPPPNNNQPQWNQQQFFR